MTGPGETRIAPTADEVALVPPGLRPLRVVEADDEYTWPIYLREAFYAGLGDPDVLCPLRRVVDHFSLVLVPVGGGRHLLCTPAKS